jgi:hypothetical protein
MIEIPKVYFLFFCDSPYCNFVFSFSYNGFAAPAICFSLDWAKIKKKFSARFAIFAGGISAYYKIF